MIKRLSAAAGRPVSRETLALLERYADLLSAENQKQNLISRATIDDLWDRHIVDSVQLVRFEPHSGASWVDIGSGAGLPGMVVACLVEGLVTLVEPRRLRADFLTRTVEALGFGERVVVVQANVEKVGGKFDVITARAVAPLNRLLAMTHHLSHLKTVWALPKGRSAKSELAEAQRAWQGVFHVEQSVTDADSDILVLTGVRAKQG